MVISEEENMKITVFNASPKGKYSITYQYIRYIEAKYDDLNIRTYHVGQSINRIIKDENYFQEIMDNVASSDLIIWCYPVYTFLVPYQMVRFIELIFDRQAEKYFENKFSTQISTSKHFYDITAHNYVQAICNDLKMHHIYGHMADMDDLLTVKGQKKLDDFVGEIKFTLLNQMIDIKPYKSTKKEKIIALNEQVVNVKEKENKDYSIVLVTDNKYATSNLGKMISWFIKMMPYNVEVVNIMDIKFKGGCLGCFHCAIEGKCIYNDGFDTFHRENILNADCIIFAATIERHWFNSIWKCYDDRQFYNGHRTSSKGSAVGYLISGHYSKEDNLKMVLEARSQVAEQFLIDIVTDEDDAETVIARIDQMVKKTIFALDKKPQRPQNFYGVGGMKIFRDLIYVMRGLMKEDHRFYKKEGIYDFPHKKKRQILLMKIIGFMLLSPKIRKKTAKQMNQFIIKPYDQLINKLKV